jgi:geranylgeranyl diphosphate synthase type II
MNEAQEYLKEIALKVEVVLDSVLPLSKTHPSSIHELMRYSIFAGGKRLRPALITAAYSACGGDENNPHPLLAGAAIEMLHTFSLIHDDLPCMDDDDFRRGKPTAHKAFNEALAVLGGDALCIFAFECLTRIGRIDIIAETAQSLGTMGMIGGQVVDIESEGKGVTRADVEYIHRNKTAALIRTCIRIGALLANTDEKTLAHLTNYGDLIGLAFQVVDDILDEEGTTEQLGKDAGSDRANQKATYPAICGLKESKQYAEKLIAQACDEVAFLGSTNSMLISIAKLINTRVN